MRRLSSKISAGYTHSLIIDKKGKVYGCGSNSYQQLGLPREIISTNKFTELPIKDNIVSVTASDQSSLLLNDKGKVIIIDNFGFRKNSFIHTNIVQISTKNYYTLLLTKEGKIHAMKSSLDKSKYFEFDEIIVQVLTGNDYSLALNDNGEVYILDIERGRIKKIPSLSGIIKMAIGKRHSLFLNNEGGAFISMNFDINNPMLIQGNTVDIACGDDRMALIDNEGIVYFLKDTIRDFLPLVRLGKGLKLLPRFEYYHFYDLDCSFTNVSAEGSHFLLLGDDGTVFSYGKGNNGQLGLGEIDRIDIPTRIEDINLS